MLTNVEKLSYLNVHLDNSALPNYYFTHKPVTTVQQHLALYAALKQQTDAKIMVAQFCRLARHYFSEDQYDIDIFQQKYSSGSISNYKDILLEYTKKGFFYPIINRLLRASKDPLQSYYGQYPMKLLYQAIKKEHSIEKRSVFTCYRGAYLSIEEIEQLKENIGKSIQTLGFLSTTLSILTAMTFATNAFIEINVDQSSQNLKDNGYAFLDQAQKSSELGQMEVLFNCLSSFKVIMIQQRTSNEINYWFIKLKYGVGPEFIDNYDKKKQEKYLACFPYISMRQSLASQCQFHAIVYYPRLLKQIGVHYCLKALHLWENIPTDSQNYALKYKEMFSYCHIINELMKNSGTVSEQQQKWINEYNEKYLTTQTQIEEQDYNIIIINLFKMFGEVSSQINNDNYEQASKLLQKLRIQFIIFKKHPQFMNDILNKDQKIVQIFDDTKQQIQILEIQINAYYVLDRQQQGFVRCRIQELKRILRNKYGWHHRKYQRLAKIGLKYKIDVGQFDAFDWISQLRYTFLLCLSANLEDWKTFQSTLWKIAQFISKRYYSEAAVLMIQCLGKMKDKCHDEYFMYIEGQFRLVFHYFKLQNRLSKEFVSFAKLIAIINNCHYQNMEDFVSSIRQQFEYSIIELFEVWQYYLDGLTQMYLSHQTPYRFQLINDINQGMLNMHSFDKCSQFHITQAFLAVQLRIQGRYYEADKIEQNIRNKMKQSAYLETIQHHIKQELLYSKIIRNHCLS